MSRGRGIGVSTLVLHQLQTRVERLMDAGPTEYPLDSA